MNADQFVSKWRHATLTERQGAQEHYLDLCRLVQFKSPGEEDPSGKFYGFEVGVKKFGRSKQQGYADVWRRGHFAWEYKKRRKDLDAAYRQLLQYQGELENPPLLITCDMDRIEVHTHFTNFPSRVHSLCLGDLLTPEGLATLRRIFHEPASFRPAETIEKITRDVIRRFGEIADSIRRKKGMDETRLAHFLTRLVFCMFAEDAGLLPGRVFSQIFHDPSRDPRHFARDIAELFSAMATGGSFWGQTIRHFNGGLFDDTPAVDLDPTHFAVIKELCGFDWSQIEPAIFGTLFEQVMNEADRSQLGAHYTRLEDIATLVEPVVMASLRRDWDATRERVESLLPFALGGGGLCRPIRPRRSRMPRARSTPSWHACKVSASSTPRAARGTSSTRRFVP